MGRYLIVIGLVLVMAGLMLIYEIPLGFGPFTLGRLPGDLAYEKDGVKVFLPLTSCIVVSIALSLLLRIWNSFRGP